MVYLYQNFRNLRNEGTKVPSFYDMIKRALVQSLIDERIAELANGLFVVDLTISSTNVIHVELDKQVGNVSIDDCMRVSRNVEHNLDREQEDFELHVSSAGLDKPLRHTKQFIKNVGREVKVVMHNGNKLEGCLVQVDEEKLVLETSKLEKPEGKKKKELVVQQHTLNRIDIKETKIVISFK